MKLIDMIINKFRKTSTLRDFGCSHMNPLIVDGSEKLNPYPRKIYLSERQVCAYYIAAVLPTEELERLETLILETINVKLPQDNSIVSNIDNEAVSAHWRNEFNGVLVELTTNSRRLINAIDKFVGPPMPPWITFPQLQPIEAVMAKQGSLEYWWEWVWMPFWSGCTPAARHEFLQQTGANKEWQELLLDCDQPNF
ncbi:hypothetical protein [Pseudomonas sp. M30-35]|uniref:hypothetical protein n=1 Tax=Pseudomonas sp. M30-35 TaxID=1981174 RepID=UPI000B3C525D|nr:hypothetical protein [Pseudomonas sp. M30-35]ARU90449.1 hypothetical protein B9K09_21930 [Pseudomonas sp. M30-35]